MSINGITGKSISRLAKGILAKRLEFARKNPDKFAANVMVLSLVSKDAVNCAFYTYQSYNNERIPEEKRKFVAALDLVQGFLNVGTQLLAFTVIKKHLTPKLFDGLIGKKLLTGLTSKYTKQISKAHPDFNVEEVSKEVKTYLGEKSNFYEASKTGFSLIVTLLATTALCKRTLVPLIATPIAGKVKDKYMNDDKNAKIDSKQNAKPQETPNLDDKLLDHSTAPWSYTSQYGDKATFKKLSAK